MLSFLCWSRRGFAAAEVFLLSVRLYGSTRAERARKSVLPGFLTTARWWRALLVSGATQAPGHSVLLGVQSKMITLVHRDLVRGAALLLDARKPRV
jgi:hypothetical protein